MTTSNGYTICRSVLPRFWEPHLSDEIRVVSLPSSSIEYQKVNDVFIKGISDLVIVEKIERIQNPGLYKMYLCKRESMGADANERQLFHGTAAESISSINTNNFNRGFSGIHGKRYFSNSTTSSPNYNKYTGDY